MVGPDKLIRQIQSVLSANLLHPKWKGVITPQDHYTAGHCYHATEVLYHLWGKKNNFKPYRMEILHHKKWISHWYLGMGRNCMILDITAEQFGVHRPEYWEGERAAFLTSKPSKRAKEVMRRLKVGV